MIETFEHTFQVLEPFFSLSSVWILLIALLIDAVIGDPHALYRVIPHPVMLIGNLITVLDSAWNRPDRSAKARKWAGVATLIMLTSFTFCVGVGIWVISKAIPFGWILEVLMVYLLIAQKSMYQHVNAIAKGLRDEGIEGGRKAVAMIVARDPSKLDEGGVSRAAIESCAENYSDGIVSPLFWYVLLGLPGLMAFKTVSTLDSMIGYLNDKYRDFGWASAKFDDLANYIPARLSGWIFVLAAAIIPSTDAKRAKTIMLRDCRIHHSPNAGWPETAMAGALGVRLLGPRQYDGYAVDDPWIGEGPYDLTHKDIKRSLKMFVVACLISAILALSGVYLMGLV